VKTLLLIILVISCLPAGCALSPLRYVVVDTPCIAGRVGAGLIGPNNGPDPTQVIKTTGSQAGLHWQINGTIDCAPTVRVKYHQLYAINPCMMVKGSIAGAKNDHPIILDTGASQAVFVKNTHVIESRLPVYPAETDQANSNAYGLGRCYLPQLRIGQVTLTDLPCWYLQRHIELEFFGLPIAKDDSIILGLPALRRFKYILFDSPNRQVEFSYNEAFEPGPAPIAPVAVGQAPDKDESIAGGQLVRDWSQYSLLIEEDRYGNEFAFVEIPIAGELMKVQLDTGSANALAIAERQWEILSRRVKKPRLKEGIDLYPYISQLACKRGVIRELQIGDRCIRDAKISVFPSDSPLLRQCKAILGTQYFQDTVIVLDFERRIMWVKNPPAAAPAPVLRQEDAGASRSGKQEGKLQIK